MIQLYNYKRNVNEGDNETAFQPELGSADVD